MGSLALLQNYLDTNKKFNSDGFQKFLLTQKKYRGLMGEFSFDTEGNANTGFVPALIKATK